MVVRRVVQLLRLAQGLHLSFVVADVIRAGMVSGLVHQGRDLGVLCDAAEPMLAEVDEEAAPGVDAAGLREGVLRVLADRARGLHVAGLVAPELPHIPNDVANAAGVGRLVRWIDVADAIHQLALHEIHRHQHALADFQLRQLPRAPEPRASERGGLPRAHLAQHRRQPGLGLRRGRRELLFDGLGHLWLEERRRLTPNVLVDNGVLAGGGEDAEEVGDAEQGLVWREGTELPAREVRGVPPAASTPGAPRVPRPRLVGALQERGHVWRWGCLSVHDPYRSMQATSGAHVVGALHEPGLVLG
mmetsp:Transcript_104895/g.294018  ORF Transcript_104895/g.294018 Transcript_104895/m.294018 type:complete len:302 (-) Transcript_104895:670-1575(-)